MRPWPARSRRSIAHALATLLVVLGPGVAWAGPPVLPPTAQEAVGQPGPRAPVSAEGTRFANTPVQRPAGMPEVQPAPVQPAAPVPTAPPAAVVRSAPAAPAAPSAPGPAPAPTASTVATPVAETSSPPTPGPAPVRGAVSEAEPELEPSAPEAAVVAPAEPPRKRFEHKGIVADVRIGTLGCIGGLCRGAHDVSPGFRIGGFLGGNIRGWVELGVGGGWGTLGSKVAPGTNAMLLYGLDPNVLQYALLAQAAGLVDVNLSGLAVQDDQLRAAQVGPSLRVHVLPRGRFGAFVGTGVGYNVLRARYQTAMGDVGMDFHGLDVPVEANFSVYVLEHLAVGVQFDYMWTWYGLAVLDHPQARIPIPMRLLEPSAATQGIDVRAQLPQFWTLGLAIRGRL